MERGEVVEDEDVAPAPPELEALLLDDLPDPLDKACRDLAAVRRCGGALLLPVHPHHRVEPHPPAPAPREDPCQRARSKDRLDASVREPLKVHA